MSFISCELVDSETQTDGGPENSSNASLTWKLGVSECIVAFLEDPSDHEVTTPGAFIKVSFELFLNFSNYNYYCIRTRSLIIS